LNSQNNSLIFEVLFPFFSFDRDEDASHRRENIKFFLEESRESEKANQTNGSPSSDS